MSSSFCSTRSIALMSESGHARRNWSGWVSGACPLCPDCVAKLSLRLRLNRDSVDQELRFAGSGR